MQGLMQCTLDLVKLILQTRQIMSTIIAKITFSLVSDVLVLSRDFFISILEIESSKERTYPIFSEAKVKYLYTKEEKT